MITFTTVLVVFGLFALVVLLMRLAPQERRRADDRPLTDRGNWR